MTATDTAPSPTRGRLLIVLATILWSLNGIFFPILTSETRLGLHQPAVDPMHIGFFRAFFAGAVLLPALRRSDIGFRPAMIFTAICFAAMNWMFVKAMSARDSVASAMFLQYTAPVWTYLACVYWLGEEPNRRGLVAVLVALLGVLLIVFGGWRSDQLRIVVLGLGSGVTYAGVLVGIRLLRGASSRWITVVNLLTGAVVLLPFMFFLPLPSGAQLATLLLCGAIQLGLPYWLMARGLRSVSAQEAGTLTLIEPLLSTLWAYLVGGQVPNRWTLIGGAFILAALLYQYAPRRMSK